MLVAARRYGVSSRFIKGLAGGFQQYRRLLRARREWPRRRAADERDERAPFHSIVSSATNSSALGTSMPRALAVCRLMTNSNLLA